MNIIRAIFKKITPAERLLFFVAIIIGIISLIGWIGISFAERTTIIPITGGSWKEGVAAQPTFPNPVFATNEADQIISELVFAPLSDLVKDVKVSKDGRTYVATLKEGLLWSDEKPLTNDDVTFTIESIQNPSNYSPLLPNWQGVIAERISELQVQFTLPAPYTFFEENVKNLRIIPKHIFGTGSVEKIQASDYALEPIGSGPYIIQHVSKRNDGFISEYIFTPNNFYVGSRPYIKKFTLLFYGNEEEMRRAYQLHTIHGFGTAMPEINKPSRGVTETIPMTRYYAVFFNTAKNPVLKNPDVRKALEKATPREKINNEILGGNGKLITGPVLFGDTDNAKIETQYDPENARALLASTKIKTINITLTVPNTPFLVATAKILKKEWEAVGVNSVSILILDPKDIFGTIIKKGSYEAIIFGNILENPYDLFSFWHSSQRDYPGLNLSFFANPQADQLLEDIRTTTNRDLILAKLGSLETLIENETPAIFLYALPYTYSHDARLKGFRETLPTTGIAAPADRLMKANAWYVFHARIVQ